MLERRVFRGLPLAGMAAAGVVVGHWLAYVVAIPNGHLRAEALIDTGHDYWSLAIKACVALVVAAFAAVTLRVAAGAPARESGRVRLFGSLLWRLGVAQLLAFTVLEVSERLAVGTPLSSLWHHHLFLLGLVVQVATTVAGALLLLGFARVVRRILAAVRARPRRAIRVVRLPIAPSLVRRPVPSEPGAVRAPPSS